MNRRNGCLNVFRIRVIVPVLFVLTFITAIMVMMGESPAPTIDSSKGKSESQQSSPPESKPPPSSTHDEDKNLSGETFVRYTAVPGYFLQDDAATDVSTFQVNTTNFGLIDRAYDTDAVFDPDRKKTQWQRFEHHLSALNKNAKDGETSKIIFFGRHGEGSHNVAEAHFGTKTWDCYYSLQDGEDGFRWTDAHLTAKGYHQVAATSRLFHTAFTTGGMPTPQTYYTSPLWRCLETAERTFHALADDLPESRPFNPIIKELFRETIGAHTCDRRSRASELQRRWIDDKGFVFEKGFTEDDELWKATERETDEATDDRAEQALDDVWRDDPNEWISVTSHSGMIASLLRVTNHRKFALETAGTIPILLKAEKVAGKRPTRTGEKWYKVSTCPRPIPGSAAV